MAGLNSLIANQTNQTTSLPSWYDTAQKNLASGAATAAGQVPGISDTVVGNQVAKLSGAANPFTQGQTALNTIASGAANPWITDASGNVTPNTSTAMGGLFAAQNQQLNQLLPNYLAPVQGANIGSGNFGSLRGMTAVDKAKADAFAALLPAQMQAALQNQQTGVSAGTGLGTTGQQEAQSNIATGTFQQNAPMAAQTALANIINPMRTGTTVNNQTQISPLNQIAGLVSVLNGVGGNTGLLSSLGLGNLNLGGLGTSISNLFGNANDWAGGMTTGQTTDANGNIITDPTYGTGNNPYTDPNIEI